MPITVAIIPIGGLLCIFGIFYIYFTTRHRERIALIDKGLDASVLTPDVQSIADMRRRILLNLAFCLIGIGLGIACGIILYQLTGIDAVYPACVFTFAGIGLLVSLLMQKRWEEDYE